MKVYHVYEVLCDDPCCVVEETARIYKKHADAKKYFDSLVDRNIGYGHSLDYLDKRYARFNSDSSNEFCVFIDDYELM